MDPAGRWPPTLLTQSIICLPHHTLGIPPWASLALASCFMRVALVPLAFLHRRGLRDVLSGVLPAALAHMTSLATRELKNERLDVFERSKVLKRLGEGYKAAFRRTGATPWNMFGIPVVQMGIFVGFVHSVRALIEDERNAEEGRREVDGVGGEARGNSEVALSNDAKVRNVPKMEIDFRMEARNGGAAMIGGDSKMESNNRGAIKIDDYIKTELTNADTAKHGGTTALTEEYAKMDLKDGGLLWFKDLTAQDAWFVLPLTALGLTFTSLELAWKLVPGLKNPLQTILLMSVPFVVQLPAGVFMYWIPSSAFALAQILVMRRTMMIRKPMQTVAAPMMSQAIKAPKSVSPAPPNPPATVTRQ